MLEILKDPIDAFLKRQGWEAARDGLPALLRDKVDEQWQPLFTPLAELRADDAVLTVPLIDASQAPTAQVGHWTWSLQGGAEAGIEVDVLDAGERDEAGLQRIDATEVYRCSLRGRLSAGVEGGAKAGAWSAGISASGELEAELDWFVAAGSSTRLGEAIVDAARRGLFVSPMDLDAQLRLAPAPSPFWGTRTRLAGALRAGLRAEAGVQKSGWSWGLDGQRAEIGFSLGVAGELSMAVEGQFELSVTPRERLGDWGLQVSLHRINRENSSLGVQLSAGADFSALARSADTFLRARLPEGTKIDALLDKLANPAGSLQPVLRKQLEQLFKKPALAAAARLALGTGEDAGALAATLADKGVGPLVELLDQAHDGSTEKLQGLRDALLARLRALLGDGPLAAPALAQLGEAADQIVAKVGSELVERIGELAKKLKGKSLAEAGQLLEPLAALGERIQAALKKLGTTIDESALVQAVRDGLADYGALRRRVIDVLGNAQRAKLLATLAVSVNESKGVETVFSAWFRRGVDDPLPGRRLFQALWSGHLDGFRDLIESARRADAIEDVDGWLVRHFERVVTERISVSLLGFEFSNQRISVAALKLKSDHAGHIVAADGQARVASEVRTRWVARQARLGLLVQTSDPGTPEQRTRIEFSGGFTVEGKSMDKAYLAGLQRSIGVLTGQAPIVDLRRLLDDSLAIDGKFWHRLGFHLPLALSDAEWTAFLGCPDERIRLAAARFGAAVLDRAYQDQAPFAGRVSARLADVCAAGEVPGADLDTRVARYLDRFPRHWNGRLGDLSNLPQYGMGNIAANTPGERQLRVFYRLARISRDLVALAVACRGLQAVLDNSAGVAEAVVFERASVHLKAIRDALGTAAVASETFTALGEKSVPWPLVLFAAVLADGSGRGAPPGFAPLAVLAGREDRPIPLLPV